MVRKYLIAGFILAVDFESDVVVINLGTNDASYCSASSFHKNEFRKKYVEFLPF